MRTYAISRSAAQSVADELMRLGVKGFCNFTNKELSAAQSDLIFEDIPFADTLTVLSY